MKLYIHRNLKDHRGLEILEDEQSGLQASLGKVCISALLADTIQDQNAGMPEKVRKWQLARLLQKNLDDLVNDGTDQFVEMPQEDIEFIKKRIGLAFKTGIVGPACHALDY